MKKTVMGLIIVGLVGVIITMGVMIKNLNSDIKELKGNYENSKQVIETLQEDNKELKADLEEKTHTVNMYKMIKGR